MAGIEHQHGDYEDGWTAPMDGRVFLANIEWREGAASRPVERDRLLRWGPVTDPVRELLGAATECFDTLDRTLAARFWRGECWVHSWRPAPAPAAG